jgi:CelD/BcsL family acetyltransferase involved in cellulose biosynthesis
MPPLLTTRILEDVRDAEALRPEWSDLAARAPRGELVLTPTWLLAWWREFGAKDGRKLRLVTFRDGDRLVGFAPFSLRSALHRNTIPVRRLELLGNGEEEKHEVCSDYAGVLCDAGYEEAIAEELTRLVVRENALGAWDELRMPLMNAEDPLVEHLRVAFGALGVAVTVEEVGRSPYAVLPKTWDAYLKQLEGSSRYVVTRALRELEKWGGKGSVSLTRASNHAELTEGRKILASLHGERWSERGEEGVFASERFARFHDEVMPQFLDGKDATLDLYWLAVNGAPISCVYNMVFHDKVYFYQSGRKLDVPKQVKPGISIQALVLQRSIELGRREYDFLNGTSQYKMKLATATRALVTLRAVAPGVRARAVEGARNLAEAVVHKVREKLSSAPPPPEDPDAKRSEADGG